MEVPLKTMGVDDTQVLDVMVSGDRIIMNEILIRCGFTEIDNINTHCRDII